MGRLHWNSLFAVVLAGGKGERFWPLSRASTPKQLLPLAGTTSLLEQTVSRITGIVPPDRVLVVTSRSLERQVRASLRSFRGIGILGEPRGRNTAPALAVASFLIREKAPGAVTVVLPSDHVVGTDAEFRRDLLQAVEAAEARRLVVFGISPSRAETGYGYVHAGSRERALGKKVFRVRRFVEKPSRATATRFYRSGSYFWNSGIFVWRADTFLEGIEEHMPALSRRLRRFGADLSRRPLRSALDSFYSAVGATSIDYGLLEKAGNIVMVRAGFSWDDLGSWTSLERVLRSDRHGNVSSGSVLMLDTRDCVLFSQEGLVAALGVRNLVIVRAEGVTLVCSKEKAQEVRKISESLSSSKKLRKFL